MNRLRDNIWAILVAMLVAAPACGQDDADQAGQDERDPLLIHWRWMTDLRLPADSKNPLLALPIAPAIFGKSQDDLRDIRLADAKGNRVPYALRVMRTESKQTELAARQYDAGPKPKSHCYEVSLELTDVPPPGHNEIEIHTSGRDFRRRVEVLGSDNKAFDDPQMLVPPKTYVALFDIEGKPVELDRFHYDLKQFRFLRVRVFADAGTQEEIPKITSVIVRRSVATPGEFAIEPAMLGPLEQVRGDGGPGSAWMIDFPARMPCEKLTFDVDSPPSGRPIRVQIADPMAPRQDIGRTEWRWREEGGRQILDISFPEVIAQRLRLVVTDFANEPLQLRSVSATRCVRKLIFPKFDPGKFSEPIRLYTGNTTVNPPNYVLAQKLPPIFHPVPAAVESGELTANPMYQPPPLKLNERMPWLVYVVLGLACAVLLAILGGLARQAIRRHDAVEPRNTSL
ncbi:MAG TPA: hypothetical protein VFE62_16710 [Gemmataceae bacterium]|nr:hypothetical protein [Gemmataceae bacterium]